MTGHLCLWGWRFLDNPPTPKSQGEQRGSIVIIFEIKKRKTHLSAPHRQFSTSAAAHEAAKIHRVVL